MAGGAAGALSGAALLGVPTYLSREVGFFGPERNLAWLAASLGFLYGIIPGTLIGLVVGLLKAHPFLGGIIGVGVGFLIVLVLLMLGLRPDIDDVVFSWTVWCIPICGVIGLITAPVSYRPVPPPTKYPIRTTVASSLLDRLTLMVRHEKFGNAFSVRTASGSD
jgi:hypothetical protein